MKAEKLIEKLWYLGFSIRGEGGDIIVSPKTIPRGLRLLLARHKEEILSLLNERQPPGLPEALTEARWVCGQLSPGDPDRRNLERVAIQAKECPDDELLTLQLMAVLVAVYRRRIQKSEPGGGSE